MKITEPKLKSVECERGVGVWIIHLADGTELKTKLVIGADGANSFVREQAFIDLDVLDYKQAGVTCAIKTAQPHQHVARQIFLETGPSAFLPMASLKRRKRLLAIHCAGPYQMIMPMNMWLYPMLNLLCCSLEKAITCSAKS